MVPPAAPDALSLAELKALVGAVLGKAAELERPVAAQREEIALLKGLKSRPPLRPSGMEQAAEPKPSRDRRGRGEVEPQVAVEDRVLRTEAVRYRRERWLTPEGRLVVAPLPGGVDGHFRPELRRYVLAQYHQGQATVPRLVAQLRAVGIAISKRQVMRLLIAGQRRFLEEHRDVPRAGLASTAWITVDATGARHRAENGSCTQIGNDHFAWFGTTASKSRLNFLDLLRAGHADYVVNAEALAYLRGRALCRSHAERLVHKLDTFTGQQRAAQARMRDLIWRFYADLKAYRREPSRRRRAELRPRSDRLFRRRTGFVMLGRLLERLHANTPELLRVLDRPEIPLHTNGSENDIRAQVTRRKVSGGTRSGMGRDCRDAFLGLAKTCARLGLGFRDCLGARLGVTGQAAIPYLPDRVRQHCQSA